MKIIGHRGARGLVEENSLESITEAILIGVDRVEFDVRMTADQELIVHHDDSLLRMTNDDFIIANTRWVDIQGLRTVSGQQIPSLKQVMRSVGNHPMLIELKDGHTATLCVETMRAFPDADICVTSFLDRELLALRGMDVSWPLFTATHWRPFKTIRFARKNHLQGVTLFWLSFNPLTYWLARKANLEVITFTINSRLLLRFIKRFMPHTWVCTDYPDRAKSL